MTKPDKKAPVRSAATAKAKQQEHPETSAYAVLEPFWLDGAVVKPPAFIEMSAAEALPYQQAGVLGTEPAEAPTADTP